MTFSREFAVKAVRKSFRCAGCGTMGEVGEPATRWVGTTDGDFDSVAYHPECRAAEIAYNRLIGNQWDDWCGLDETEAEDEPWLLAEHPLAAARKGIVAPTRGGAHG